MPAEFVGLGVGAFAMLQRGGGVGCRVLGGGEVTNYDEMFFCK